jgi:hypothetical protein
MDASQNPAVTKLCFVRCKFTSEDQAFRFELRQADFDGFERKTETRGERGGGHGSDGVHPTAQDAHDCLRYAFAFRVSRNADDGNLLAAKRRQ